MAEESVSDVGEQTAKEMGYRNANPGETLEEYKARLGRLSAKSREAKKRKREQIEAAKKAAHLERQNFLAEIIPQIEARSEKRGVDLSRDMVWVYRNLGVVDVKYESAPSVGAVELLEWVLADDGNRKHFYQSHLPRALAMQEARQKAEREKKAKKEAEKKAEEEKDLVRDLTLFEAERILKAFAEADEIEA